MDACLFFAEDPILPFQHALLPFKKDDAGQSSCGIDQYIGKCMTSSRNEGLMELVRGGVQKYEQQRIQS